MGFSWDFSGTTLIKRLCKSLLKKKLGDLLLGDIDLDQLDVQLTTGTLHLSDLALNAGFINDKIAGSTVILKEGSMKSLSIKIPLKLKSCEIELEELELIIAPNITTDIAISSSDCSTSSSITEPQQAKDPQKSDAGYTSFNSFTSRDVDEGVKRIANVVKWFLTSFHVRIKNIYIVLDPSTIPDVRNSASNRSLVLRIKETEFGTCLSEDASVKLNNFMNFKEAALEFLQMEELEKNNRSIGDITTPVLKGPIGGFSGTLNLSIPWKNGSLSLQKLDADVSVDALELNVQPSTIDWALAVWQSMQLSSSRSSAHKGMELSAFSPRLNMSSVGNVSKVEVHTAKAQEKTQDEFLRGTHFIQNWLPKLADKDEQGAVDSDCNDDASIDQFFECFEGMRSSQMGSGNSGIWNWTCSVFNAITFADTLATGVNHLPPEQLTDKTLHASISETCIIIYFDEQRPVTTEGRDSEFYMSCFSSMHPGQSSTTKTDINNIKLQHLEARFQDIILDFETYPQNLKLKASIGQISLDEFYNGRYYEQILLTPHLKRDIQGCLPPFSFNKPDAHRCVTNSQVGLVRVSLLKSFGKCSGMYATSFTGSDSNSTIASLVISLPPFTFWVHFHLIHMLIQLINQVESSLKKSPRSTQTEVAKSSVKREHPKSSFKSRIVLQPSRIFLCFPSEFNRDFSRPSLFDKFLVFDHFLTLNLKEHQSEMLEDCQTSSSSSVHLDVQNLDAYLIEPSNQNFSATKIVSTSNYTVEHGFGINFSWKTSCVTDPCILSRAWSLATLHNQKSAKRCAGNGSGFSSSTSLGDLHDMCSNIRQELILSTQSLLHVKLSRILVDLSKKHYVLLLSLIDQAVRGLSKNAVNTSDGEVEEKKELISNVNSSLQTSIFLECGTFDVCAQLDEVMEVSHLLQRELKGSWKGLKLCIKDFELLSVANLGGVKDARYLWLNNGEGKLLGSIINQPQMSDMENSKDFLLVVCSDSSSGRGDGAGTNALSCGKAGTSFITIFNSDSLETYTSVIVSCATVVAPGGRLDWIQAIILFFSLPSQDVEEPSMDGAVKSQMTSTSSFYLDLVDVALSYEPHAQKPTEYTETSNLGPSFFLEPDAEMEKKCVACLLAASSLSLSNNTMSNLNSTDHDIHLQDLGLLICESDGSEIIAHGSSPDYLRRVGYVRIAQNTLIAAALRMSGSFWKLDMTDSSFNISVCRDTLFGLIRLASQLQQIYAPDMQDAVAHLQSRWNSMKLEETEGLGPSHSRVSKGESENVSVSQEGFRSGGLLDEIVENAFYTEEQNGPFDYYAVNLPYEDAEAGSEGKYVSSFSPEIIDAYCSPDFLSSSARNRVSASSNEDTDRGNGGWYGDQPLNIVEDHISEARNSTEGESSDQGGSYYFDTVESAEVPCNLKGQVALTNIDVSLRMFAGDDWSDRLKEIPSCSSHVTQRDGDSCLELVLSGLDLCYNMYPDDEICVSRMHVSSQDINLFDQSKNAPWKMILGWYSSKDYPRESCSKALKLKLESIRPEPPTPLEDYRLQLEILPLRLHLDQGQLNFLVDFFRNDSGRDPDSSGLLPHDSDQLEASARESISSSGSQAIVEEALLPFFQKFDVRPLVVRVDYIPRQFDPAALSRGNYAEVLNLVPWKGIDLKLKSVSAVGVYGWGSICETVLGEWLEDISHNQVRNLLKGLTPIRSLFAVSSGTSKLVSLPIKSYRKDGKLLKGMQRGAVAFIRSISIEAVGLGVHLAAGAHEMLLKTECILTAVPPMPHSDRRRKPNVRSNQPEDAQQGIQQAYESLTEGLGRTASAVIRTPLKVYQHGAGAGSALATAVRSAPGAVIAPISASAGAVHYALLGLRNSLDPEHKRESMDKYLGPSQL